MRCERHVDVLLVGLLALFGSCASSASGDQAASKTQPVVEPSTTSGAGIEFDKGISTVPILTSATDSDDASVFEMPKGVDASSCAFDYSPEALRARSWAFDGTLVSVGDVADSHMGSVPAATFNVNHWYRGGDTAQVTVEFDMGTVSEFVHKVTPGARLLVTGEPRWGGRPLDDPVAWGCGFSRPWSSQAGQQWSAWFDATQAFSVDGPVVRYPYPSIDTLQMASLASGTLQLEGPCLYISSDEAGERYPVVWPTGTRWDEANTAVISPRGDSMPIGREVSGSGGFFYVSDVEYLVSHEAAKLASQCVDNQYGEIAMVNNVDTGIGLAGN